jgi:hypothetical protein
VLKLLANFKIAKAAGPYFVRPVVLKELRNEIIDIITILLPKSLSSGAIPSDWNRAYFCPIYKKVTAQTQPLTDRFNLSVSFAKRFDTVSLHISLHISVITIFFSTYSMTLERNVHLKQRDCVH